MFLIQGLYEEAAIAQGYVEVALVFSMIDPLQVLEGIRALVFDLVHVVAEDVVGRVEYLNLNLILIKHQPIIFSSTS